MVIIDAGLALRTWKSARRCPLHRDFKQRFLLTRSDKILFFRVLTLLIDAVVNVLKLLVVIKHNIFVENMLMIKELVFESRIRCKAV